MHKHQVRYQKCESKPEEEQRQKCRNNTDRWRNNQLKKCNPIPETCESIANAEREKEIKECEEIQDPEERNQCVASADGALRENLEVCQCKEIAEDAMKPMFEACRANEDETERNICLEYAQEALDDMHEQCENPEPDCYEAADEYYVEFIQEHCENDMITDVEREQCYEKARMVHERLHQECGMRECHE